MRIRSIPGQHPKLLALALAGLLLGACSSETPEAPKPAADPQVATTAQPAEAKTAPRIIEMTDDEVKRAGESAKRQLTFENAEGINVELWAPEKLLADPVAISVDNQGRIWTTITNRSNNSEFDIRGYQDWEIPSMTFTTVEDRRNFLRTELAPEKSEQNKERIPDRNGDGSHDWRDLAFVKEEVVMLQDTTGNGSANRAQLFIQDFGDEVTDVMGGIYYHNQRDELFVAVGPDAWRVKDTDGDGMADTKHSIAHGFNVHIGFSGHGMSGVILGPDGRIYYGIGDPGASITDSTGKKWHYPNQGIIVRSEPDGSNFEVFAAGVRNTHEFVFDKYGNLITVDNDGDHVGEYERLLYVIDGSDSGWRINWQLGKYKDPKNNTYKVWMDEDYYKPHFKGQSALILPPVAPYHSGPAGMVYNPGTAWSNEWLDHFFVVEFVGSAPRSGINAFTLEPDGASFRLASDKKVFRGVQGTGLDWGPDGALYMSDWIEGWGRNGKGRIWKLDTPATAGNETRADTQARLAEDFGQHGVDQLIALMAHADMRVRSKAQFELVERKAVDSLQAAAQQTEHQLQRIHGLWGIGQLARAQAEMGELLLPYLSDSDAEIRAQAARLLGDAPFSPAAEALIKLLKDPEIRVQFFAAQALGRLGVKEATAPLVALLEQNQDKDVYLRQAVAIALSRIGDEAALAALSGHASEAVRIGAVVALGRMKSPELARFLDDASEFVTTNAARAISDDDFVTDALPALAAMLEQTRFTNEPLTRRAINANLYEGKVHNAQRLAAFAQRTSAEGALRAEALKTLGVWAESSIFDRVTGLHRGAVKNNAEDARAALSPIYETLLADESPEVREASVLVLGDLNFRETQTLLAKVLIEDAAAPVRIAALNTLKSLGYLKMSEAVFAALNDKDQSVRMAALGMVPTLDLPVTQVVEMHQVLLDKGTEGEQQAALVSLANVKAPEAYQVIEGQMRLLIEDKLTPALQLELITSAEKIGTPALTALLAEYEATKDASKPMEVFREALHGGDAMRGRMIFRHNSTAQCVRCHIVGKRGNLVGPELTAIAHVLDREQMLAAMVDPAARIAPGFGRITAVMNNGERIEGFFESETPTTKTLVSGDNKRAINKADIAKVEAAASGMPPMGMLLNKSQLRDLVAYLMTLQGQDEDAPSH